MAPPTRFNVNEQKMLDYYDQLMDQVKLLYHTHPTNLTHIGLTDAEIADMVYYDAMGKEMGGNLMKAEASNLIAQYGPDGAIKEINKRKKVHLHSDLTHSNGLRRGIGTIQVVQQPQMSNVSFVLWMLLFIALSGACFWVFMMGEI